MIYGPIRCGHVTDAHFDACADDGVVLLQRCNSVADGGVIHVCGGVTDAHLGHHEAQALEEALRRFREPTEVPKAPIRCATADSVRSKSTQERSWRFRSD